MPASKLESRKTRLVQRTIGTVGDANEQFTDTGPDGKEACIVTVPENDACCFNCLVEVPSGPNVLWSSFGANMGKLDPGMKLCWPAWNSVTALISKQVVTYNAAPKKCPTKDKVFVDVDLSINLRVGSDMQSVETFFFQMGPARLDAYLYFEVEEIIRSLVNEVKYDKVNDLRGDFSSEMLRTLQQKLRTFGVDVMSVKITDVQLPRELQIRLEKTTAFATRIAESEKNQNYRLQQLKNDHQQQMAAIQQNTSIEKQRVAAESAKYEITQDEAMSVATSDRNVRVEKAKGDMEVAVTKAKGSVEVAQYTGRSQAEAMVTGARIKAEEELRTARLESQTSVKGAEAERNASGFLAQALLESSKAEGEAAAQLEQKTVFEQRMLLADIDAFMAGVGRKFLSGDTGASIIKSFVMVRDDLK